MSLPANWVDSLFARLAVRYGRDWLSKWEGLDMQAVKDDWAEELSGFQQLPDAIRYGIEHLPPDRPPNVQQFREICRKYRGAPPEQPAIAGPKVSPEEIEKAQRKIRETGEALRKIMRMQ